MVPWDPGKADWTFSCLVRFPMEGNTGSGKGKNWGDFRGMCCSIVSDSFEKSCLFINWSAGKFLLFLVSVVLLGDGVFARR